MEKERDIFSDRRNRADTDRKESEVELYRQIRQLKVELYWPKENSVARVLRKRAEVDAVHPDLLVLQQFKVLDLSSSTSHYRPTHEAHFGSTAVLISTAEAVVYHGSS